MACNELMKPFYEAGLKDLASVTGYPLPSIQNCTQFQRTHHVLLETWESFYRHMLQKLIKHRFDLQMTGNCAETPANVNRKLISTLQEFSNENYDRVAIQCVINSLPDELKGLDQDFQSFVQQQSEVDNTWKFWERFVFQDCLPYITMFIAIRSGNWAMRMAAIKLMAADFSAFDHPTYQRLITSHVLDVLQMPCEILSQFEKGGFVVSICGREFLSVGVDEAHEMLMNKHTKQL